MAHPIVVSQLGFSMIRRDLEDLLSRMTFGLFALFALCNRDLGWTLPSRAFANEYLSPET
jgi:hypothetical protein